MIDLSKLFYLDKIEINEDIKLDDSYISKNILGFESININGFIFLEEETYKIKGQIIGNIYLEDAKSLNKVPYHIDITLDDEIEKNLVNKQNMLDLNEFLWQNIVLEVPISYSKEEPAKTSGDNWEYIKDETSKKVDSRMQKILEYNKGGEENGSSI